MAGDLREESELENKIIISYFTSYFKNFRAFLKTPLIKFFYYQVKVIQNSKIFVKISL